MTGQSAKAPPAAAALTARGSGSFQTVMAMISPETRPATAACHEGPAQDAEHDKHHRQRNAGGEEREEQVVPDGVRSCWNKASHLFERCCFCRLEEPMNFRRARDSARCPGQGAHINCRHAKTVDGGVSPSRISPCRSSQRSSCSSPCCPPPSPRPLPRTTLPDGRARPTIGRRSRR